MLRSVLTSALLAGAIMFGPVPRAEAQVYYRDQSTGQWVYDAKPYKKKKAKRARVAAGPEATYKSCRRQVRRAAGIVPGTRARLPRAYQQFIDRCVANGGVYT